MNLRRNFKVGIKRFRKLKILRKGKDLSMKKKWPILKILIKILTIRRKRNLM